ncbi:transposon Tf2-6 polyprotein [Trichonephila clavipes]|nr:transposon Tf2-6 polyprotein [Trichonephila clavipes]
MVGIEVVSSGENQTTDTDTDRGMDTLTSRTVGQKCSGVPKCESKGDRVCENVGLSRMANGANLSFRGLGRMCRCSGQRRHRGSANRQLIPANDPKCVVIHYSEDQLASFKNFVVIHSVFSGVITENQRIARTRRRVRLIVEASLTKPKLKDLIVKSPDYIEDDVKVMIDSIVKDRIRTEEEKLRREEREYELEKLRIQAEKNANTMNNPENVQAPKVIHETFHKFNMKDDITLNLTLFERHAELTFLPKKEDTKPADQAILTFKELNIPRVEVIGVRENIFN